MQLVFSCFLFLFFSLSLCFRKFNIIYVPYKIYIFQYIMKVLKVILNIFKIFFKCIIMNSWFVWLLNWIFFLLSTWFSTRISFRHCNKLYFKQNKLKNISSKRYLCINCFIYINVFMYWNPTYTKVHFHKMFINIKL